jgi:hypothetical protein
MISADLILPPPNSPAADSLEFLSTDDPRSIRAGKAVGVYVNSERLVSPSLPQPISNT